MKNKLLIFFSFIFYSLKVHAENVFIEAKNISLDKNRKISYLRMR